MYRSSGKKDTKTWLETWNYIKADDECDDDKQLNVMENERIKERMVVHGIPENGWNLKSGWCVSEEW